jgi:hypothetical protein
MGATKLGYMGLTAIASVQREFLVHNPDKYGLPLR